MTGSESGFPVELLRSAPDLLATVAQVLWVAAPQRRLAADDVDDAGLVPLRTDAPLAPAEEAAFERGLDALLREASSRERGVYLREVRDARGVRRELGVPADPASWSGALTMVGPFDAMAEAEAWRAERLGPPLVGDPLWHDGRLYVDVFSGEGERSAASDDR
jgi:hypothetical protein